MDDSSELDLFQLMEDASIKDILLAMRDRALWYASRPGVLPGHSAYWINTVNVLQDAALRIKEET
jgi:hypothetical protein